MSTAPEELDLSSEFDGSWKTQAACQGQEQTMFFDERKSGGKAFCNVCPVKADCLDWALLTDQRFGIWGGMSTLERKIAYPEYLREAMREDYR